MDPGTAMLLATAFQAGIEGGGKYLQSKAEKKVNKRKTKQKHRETTADLYDESLNRSQQTQAHKMKSGARMSKSKSNSMQDTADLVRGAFNI